MHILFLTSLFVFILSYLGLCWIIAKESQMRLMKIDADEKLVNHMAISKLNK